MLCRSCAKFGGTVPVARPPMRNRELRLEPIGESGHRLHASVAVLFESCSDASRNPSANSWSCIFRLALLSREGTGTQPKINRRSSYVCLQRNSPWNFSRMLVSVPQQSDLKNVRYVPFQEGEDRVIRNSSTSPYRSAMSPRIRRSFLRTKRPMAIPIRLIPRRRLTRLLRRKIRVVSWVTALRPLSPDALEIAISSRHLPLPCRLPEVCWCHRPFETSG